MGDDAHPKDSGDGPKRSDVFDRKYDNDAQKQAWDDVKRPLPHELFVIVFSTDGTVKLKVKSSLAGEDATVWVKRKPNGKFSVGMGFGEEEYSWDQLSPELKALLTGRGRAGSFEIHLPPMDYIIDNGRRLTYDEYLFKLQHDPGKSWSRMDPRLFKQLSDRYWSEYQDSLKSDPESIRQFEDALRGSEQYRQAQEKYRTWGTPGS